MLFPRWEAQKKSAICWVYEGEDERGRERDVRLQPPPALSRGLQAFGSSLYLDPMSLAEPPLDPEPAPAPAPAPVAAGAGGLVLTDTAAAVAPPLLMAICAEFKALISEM